ncbi:helix-turn-helix domain-containing protein [Alkalihalophilus marmarensis]|uniref:helix-turn-helix domain-containing protein n=1 Tax=Alkalihalophilus marmarensis TaxID=521377 RepID=UPI002E1C91D7|nr:helix-turn-helix domain-containing protein [Alkalihalophilus marmarensis]
MKIKHVIVLTVLKRFKGERTIYGAYHLLQGKKSAQTIQDGHYYTLLPYFGLFPKMKREEMDTIAAACMESGYLKPCDKDCYLVTEKGDIAIRDTQAETPIIRRLNGFKYGRTGILFWQRFTLFIQSLTQLLSQSGSFIPIIQDRAIQKWVKARMPNQKNKRMNVLRQLHIELKQLLERFPDRYALFIVLQLTTEKKVGYTSAQAAHTCGFNVEDAWIIHQAMLHEMLEEMEKNEKKFPVLQVFIERDSKSAGWTKSADQTARLIQQGHTLDQIATKRKLKRSTIEDHIIEIALQQPDFSIKPYVTEEIKQKINAFMKEKGSSVKLRDIKEALGDEVSYFMIRLVLARKEE